MPNWCYNSVEVTHDDPAMVQKFIDATREGAGFINTFVPVPADLQIVSGFVGEDKQAEHEAKQKENIAKHGYKDWYDFCVNEWGTKWDVDCAEAFSKDGAIHTSFDSAWSPPIAFYEKLADLGYTVKAYYFEPGMNFAGIWEDGFDDFYELSEFADADEVEANIPVELNEMFDIVQQMRDWEEENEEDEE